MAVLADAQHTQIEGEATEQFGIAPRLDGWISGVTLEVVELEEWNLRNDPLAHVAPEARGVIAGHPDVLVHVEPSDRAPFDARLGAHKDGEERELRVAGREHDVGDTALSDRASQHTGGLFCGRGGEALEVRVDNHGRTTDGECL
jgi:hypothetical protein